MSAERFRLLLLALPSLTLALPTATAATRLHLAICGSGALDLPLPRRGHEDPHPTACHAMMCTRNRPDERTDES